MKHILHNLRCFIRHERLIFIVMIVCILSSAFILNFSYGLYRNFQTAKTVEVESLNELALEIQKDHAPTCKQVRQFIESLSEETLNETTFFISGTIDTLADYNFPYLESRFVYQNKEYTIPTEFRKNAEDKLMFGRMITDEEEQSSALVACVETSLSSKNVQESVQSIMTDDETLVFMNQEYHIVGGSGVIANIIVPFLSVPDDFVYDDVIILDFKQPLNRTIYQEIIAASTKYMPDALIFPDLKLPDHDTISIFDNIIAISILISVFSAFNFVLLYHFILNKRNHDLAVMRVCGCSKLKVFGNCIGECLLISMPFYVLGTGIYIFLLHAVLKKNYPYISDVYSLKVYALIFALYIIILMLAVGIMVLSHINQSIVSQLKEKKI